MVRNGKKSTKAAGNKSNRGGRGTRSATPQPGGAPVGTGDRDGNASDIDPTGDRTPSDGEWPDANDDLDDMQFDPTVRDILGDFGLDDEETLPEESDFWFAADEDFDD